MRGVKKIPFHTTGGNGRPPSGAAISATQHSVTWFNGQVPMASRCAQLLFVFVVGSLAAGCDSKPESLITEPQVAVVEGHGFSGSVEVDETSYSRIIANGKEKVSFSDEYGNDYDYEVSHDSQGRVTKIAHWYNGKYVGKDVPEWSGMEVTRHVATANTGAWTETTPDGEPTTYSDGGLSIQPVLFRAPRPMTWPTQVHSCASVIDVSSNTFMQESSDCSDEGWDFAMNTGGLVVASAAVAGTTVLSSTVFPPAVTVAVGTLALATANWARSALVWADCITGDEDDDMIKQQSTGRAIRA